MTHDTSAIARIFFAKFPSSPIRFCLKSICLNGKPLRPILGYQFCFHTYSTMKCIQTCIGNYYVHACPSFLKWIKRCCEIENPMHAGHSPTCEPTRTKKQLQRETHICLKSARFPIERGSIACICLVGQCMAFFTNSFFCPIFMQLVALRLITCNWKCTPSFKHLLCEFPSCSWASGVAYA